MAFIFNLIVGFIKGVVLLVPKVAFPWLRQMAFDSAVKSAGKGALKRTPLNFRKPNMLVTAAAVATLNAANFIVMLILKGRAAPALISSGIVTLLTAFFILSGIRKGSARKERVALLITLAFFFAVFALFVAAADLWWVAWMAKLILEVLLCYSIMLTKKGREADKVQSRALAFVIRRLRLRPEGRLARLLMRLDPF
ncbi:MAG: hypothetical protein FWE70_01285 [Oscillospiraceae bacterium]|nr:hypothetical protein [Oscillospiraceae bacterium]